jgi:uncharacterized membrane protein YwaF
MKGQSLNMKSLIHSSQEVNFNQLDLSELLDVNNLEKLFDISYIWSTSSPIISLIAADIGATAIVVSKIHSFYYF